MSVGRWIKAGTIVAAVVCALAPLSPSLVERWYSTGVYPRVQHVVTPISNLIPFALFDVLTIGANAREGPLRRRAEAQEHRGAAEEPEWEPG